MKSKKAQIIGEVFLFIMAAALAVLIIIYGYKALSGFTSRTEEISLVNFKTDLQSEIRTIASDYGSVKKLDLTMPGRFDVFCLIDIEQRNLASTTGLCTLGHPDYNPEVCDAWETEGNEENAFLIPITPIKVSKMDIDGGYLCIKPTGNKISLRLEGLGDRTKVSEWAAVQE